MSGYTQLDNNMVELGDVFSQELADAIRKNIEYLNRLIPIGHIVPIMVNIPGVPTPDANVWQLCDGSEITNPNSPLRSTAGSPRYTPNLIDRFIKVSHIGESGNIGGTHTLSFTHAHGGQTGYACMNGECDPSHGAIDEASCHLHSISSDLAGPYDWQPPFYTVKFFVKIT